MSQETLRIQKISGHAGTVPGEDTQREFTVCKLVDTTTLHRLQGLRSGLRGVERHAVLAHHLRQHLSDDADTRWNYWNLILFNEHEREDGTLQWLMRQTPVHALRRARLSGSLPPPTEPSFSTPTASWISSRITASAAAIASRAARSTFRSSTVSPSGCTSVPCARIASARGLNLLASSPAPPAACTLAPRTT